MSFCATIKSEPPDMGYENLASDMTVTPAIGLPNVKIEPDTLLPSTSDQETLSIKIKPDIQLAFTSYQETLPIKTEPNTLLPSTSYQVLTEPDTLLASTSDQETLSINAVPDTQLAFTSYQETLPIKVKPDFLLASTSDQETLSIKIKPDTQLAFTSYQKTLPIKVEPDTRLASTSYQETRPSLELYQVIFLTENEPFTNKTQGNCNQRQTKYFSSQLAVIVQKRKQGTCEPLEAPPAKKLAFTATSQNSDGSQKTFSCKFCKMRFAVWEQVEKHRSVCPKNKTLKKFSCKFCKMHFAVWEQVEKHISMCPKNNTLKKFSCKFCNMHFAVWEQVEKHISECPKKCFNVPANGKGTSVFKCSFCGSNSFGWEEAYQHAATCAASKEKDCTTGPFPCKTCGSKFKLWEELILHASNCMFSRYFTCINCGELLKGVEKFRKHTEMCNRHIPQPSRSEKPRPDPNSKTAKDVTCKFCKITFQRDDHLKKHAKFCSPLNSINSSFPCTYCKLTFGNEEYLKEHTKFCAKVRILTTADSMHGDNRHKYKNAGNSIIFNCHICKTKFDNWNEKLKHTSICKQEHEMKTEKSKAANKQEQMRKDKSKTAS